MNLLTNKVAIHMTARVVLKVQLTLGSTNQIKKIHRKENYVYAASLNLSFFN